jgi:hypothetical protein
MGVAERDRVPLVVPFFDVPPSNKEGSSTGEMVRDDNSMMKVYLRRGLFQGVFTGDEVEPTGVLGRSP